MSGIPAGAGSLLGKRLGKYEILALLALGGTAEIYLARIAGAAGFEKYVVVKCLHDHLADDTEFVKMFLDEARLAAYLDHSNIVQTMELGEHENRYYMVMEYLAGLSLAMIVRRAAERMQGGRIPIPLVLNMIAQSCAGLHYAHERNANGKALNIVHRDISPQNLVVSFEGVVKVVDFGIAKAEMRETRTRSGTIKGKFAYMSPEQCVANNVDRRTDVFALGVITHELLTGRRLFKKPSPYETYQAVIECAVEAPSRHNVEVDPALDPIVMKAVAKDKEARYPTAEAFGDAILGYLHHRGKGSGPGDVARFFDAQFAQEIEEHGARMRELISGRDVSLDTGVNWGDEEAKRNETVDLTGGSPARQNDSAMSLDTADLLERGSQPSLSGVIDDLAPPDSDDMPADRTRIEANPLERINELEASIATDRKTPLPPQIPTVIAPDALPPQAHQMPPSGPLPLPAPPTGPIQTGPANRPSSGKFPNAHLPTMVADDDMVEVAAASPEFARTEIGGPLITPPPMTPAPARVDPLARTSMDMQLAGPNGGVQRPPMPMPPNAPVVGPQRPNPPSSPPPMGMQAQPGRPPTPPQVASLPVGYPVVNRQMSQQMLQGATVYPSDFGSGPQQANPHQYDPAHAANFASPVGPGYMNDVDWAAAAAAPAKAIPPWKLAVIFAGALLAALLVTIMIAKIFG